MIHAPRFSHKALITALTELGIAHRQSGTDPADAYAFKSLRNPEPKGVYFITGGRAVPAQITPSVVICGETDSPGAGNTGLHVVNPQLAFYRLMGSLVPNASRPPGIHPTAIVDAESRIEPSASIGPYCVIEGAVIGERVQLHSHVVVMPGTQVENDVVIEPHSTLGATGVAWVWDPATNSRVMQPQTGATLIGAGCFLGSDVTVVRGSVNEVTTIGPGTVIAHGSKIGHGCVLAAECHLANNVSLAGNVTLGARSFVGAGAIVRPQVRLAEETVVGAGAVVIKSSETPRAVLFGNPASPRRSADRPLSGVPQAMPPNGN